MLNDVTFGQYYPAKSFVHSMDPRTKLLALIAFIVAIFIAQTFYGMRCNRKETGFQYASTSLWSYSNISR